MREFSKEWLAEAFDEGFDDPRDILSLCRKAGDPEPKPREPWTEPYSKKEMEEMALMAYKKLWRKFWDNVEHKWHAEPTDWACRIVWNSSLDAEVDGLPTEVRFSLDGGTGPRFTYIKEQEGEEFSLEDLVNSGDYSLFGDFSEGKYELEPLNGLYKEDGDEPDMLDHPNAGEMAEYDENDNPRIYPESVSPKFETRLGKIWECLSTGMFGNSQPTAGVFSGDNFASGDTRIPVPLGGYTRMGKAGKKRKFRKISK